MPKERRDIEKIHTQLNQSSSWESCLLGCHLKIFGQKCGVFYKYIYTTNTIIVIGIQCKERTFVFPKYREWCDSPHWSKLPTVFQTKSTGVQESLVTCQGTYTTFWLQVICLQPRGDGSVLWGQCMQQTGQSSSPTIYRRWGLAKTRRERYVWREATYRNKVDRARIPSMTEGLWQCKYGQLWRIEHRRV